MISFVNYLFESGISLSLFALVYFLFLRRETFFNVNRWFLLIAVIFSAVLPLLHIPFYAPQPTVLAEITITPYVNLLSAVTIYGATLTHGAERFVLTYSLFGYIYLVGALFFAAKLFVQIYQIYRLIAKNRVVSNGKIKMVFLEREISPFSFLNYIFVGNNLRNTKGWEKMVEHEKQHIQQGHSVDVLVLEFVAVFQWFNPFFWMFRRALRENHEFLADHAVISKGTAASWYKQILINQYVGDQIVLANNFNYSLIKTRIKMISKIKSRKIASFKILIGFVLAVSLVAAFACEQKDSVKTENTSSGKTVSLDFDGHALQINGDSVGIEKLQDLIQAAGDYQIVKNSTTGALELKSKSNKVDEVVAVSYNKQEKSAQESSDVFVIVDTMPVYSGGDPALRKFIAQNVKYPSEASKKGIQGKVYVNFVVEKDGSVGMVKIVRGVDPSLDKEALRVVSLLSKWTPGMQKGQPVRVAYTMPINFALQ
ncbi:MAG: M56 family metallopeptidase [Prolixibacteraceae bacterium]|jgi:TonB family protein